MKHALSLLLAILGFTLHASEAEPPNIILILTDDMGYSDIGCFGSEIKTPNLDRLASNGIRFSQFYNTSRCCPTRASLLTGLYSHQAGVGHMMTDKGADSPGYRGRLTKRCLTIAEVLKPTGYRTIQTGKWHLGDKEKAWWPINRGFDRVFGCTQGGGFYFRPSSFKLNREIVRGDKVIYDQKNDPPEGWYATDAYTDEGLAYVDEAITEEKPFFWYLAYNAPHYPLQAKPEDIAKYQGRYLVGWDKIREERYRKLIQLGLIDKNWNLPPRDKSVPAWNTLSQDQKEKQDLRMATYAAMIDCIDQNVGKILTHLENKNALENTLILFLHDNGADTTGGHLGSNKGKDITGSAESEVYYGTCWANVSDTPFRKYKTHIHEGGIASPLIAHWPREITSEMSGKIATTPTHLIDIMATCTEITGATYPTKKNSSKIIPLEGKSLLPIFENTPFQRDAPLFFEHQGNRGLREGDWKLVAQKGKPWELYNLKADRTELNNLANEMPEKVTTLSALYDQWALRALVTK